MFRFQFKFLLPYFMQIQIHFHSIHNDPYFVVHWVVKTLQLWCCSFSFISIKSASKHYSLLLFPHVAFLNQQLLVQTFPCLYAFSLFQVCHLLFFNSEMYCLIDSEELLNNNENGFGQSSKQWVQCCCICFFKIFMEVNLKCSNGC